MSRPYILSVAFFLISAAIASAHEFWIDPEKFILEPDEELVANLRVGQEFVGAPFSYIPARFTRFELRQGDQTGKITSRIGDRPALSQPLPAQGLWTIIHETRDNYLTYEEEGLFTDFVTDKDLRGVLDAHAARGFEETGFSESYRRFAKSLVAVGSGEGADVIAGLRTEIVALSNPYSDLFDGTMRVQVLFEGEPRSDEQVEIFERAPDGAVSITTTRTDDNGNATVPVKPGYTYLLDSVTMLPVEPSQDNRNAVWASLWASLTFAVPE